MGKRTGEDRRCKQCSGIFYVPGWRLRDNTRGMFCSKSCAATAKTGKRASNWRGGKQELYGTFKCVTCTRSFCSRYPRPNCSIECRAKFLTSENHHNWKGGMLNCQDCGKKLNRYKSILCRSCSHRGDRSYLWKGGITPINKLLRKRRDYALWRYKVFKRDNYTCQMCGETGVYIQADHIKPFALFPELRLELSNGQTLCIDCHKLKTSVDYSVYNMRLGVK